MEELYELKRKLCDELKEYGHKEMSAGTLDVVDKLAHTVKNLDKIIENYDGNYSNYMHDGSYARNRDARGRYSSRGYSRNYSYHGDMMHELNELMEEAPDERTKQEFKRFIQKIESM